VPNDEGTGNALHTGREHHRASGNTADFQSQGVRFKSLAKHMHGFSQSSQHILDCHSTNVPSWFHIVQLDDIHLG
jgi:hypothetical protein